MQKTLFIPQKVEVFKKEIDEVICKPISHRLAKSIIVENHYTHAFPPTKIALGFFVEGNIGGVITFGEGANRNMVPGFYEGLTHVDGLELTRLFAFDWCGKNFESMMISKSF